MNDDRIWIAPEIRDAKKIAQVFAAQGNGRGFWEDGNDTLILFDSYGWTHGSMGNYLRVRVGVCLIVQKTGDVSLEGVRRMGTPIHRYVTPEETILFNRIKSYMGGCGECMAIPL